MTWRCQILGRLIAILVGTILFGVALGAAPQRTIDFYTIVDLRAVTFEWCPTDVENLNRLQPANVAYNFTAASAAAINRDGWTLTQWMNCAADDEKCGDLKVPECKPPSKLTRADYAAWMVLELARTNVKLTTDRWVSDQGEGLRIFVVTDKGARKPDVAVKEEARKTMLARDIKTLLQIISNVSIAQARTGDHYSVYRWDYILTKRRAETTVEATLKDDDGKVLQTVAPKIITGPAEHLYLSADIPISSGEQLKFDEENDEIITREDPSAVHVALNFRLGDLYTDNRFWQKLTLKGFLAASKRPTDAYGAGLGLRGDLFGKWGVDLTAFSPYVAWISVKNDDEAIAKGASERSSDVRFGISVNLDRAVDWLTPDKDEEEDKKTNGEADGSSQPANDKPDSGN